MIVGNVATIQRLTISIFVAVKGWIHVLFHSVLKKNVVMINRYLFIRPSKKSRTEGDPINEVAGGCLIILFLLIIAVFTAFVFILRGSKRAKALEQEINSLKEKVQEQEDIAPGQRAALEVYPFPDPGYGRMQI